jgi:tRNA nucleotidyltransferase/poly(A) polymerase
MAVTDNDEYEIATFQERDESNLQSTGEIDVKFSDMKGDISRRDLTINALFYDIGTDEVVDLVGGIDDVRNNVIRSVGKPEDRFEDDSIRKLRAIRFAARTGSKLDPDIDRALKNDPSIHPKVARIPINDEFFKGIKQAKDVKNYLSLLDNYDMWEYIVPLAVLFNNNNPVELRKKLSGKGDTMNYSSELANGIKYLIQLKGLNSDNAILFKKNQSASDQQIRTFARLMNLDMKLIEALLKFNLSVKGGEAMQRYGLTQKDKSKIGQAIKDLETEKFKELL